MPLPRLLLPLCGLLLALAVTSATAAAPSYGPGEVSISVWKDLAALSRYSQEVRCKKVGGSLVPMVTETVHTLVTNALDSAGIQNTFCNMGASTMLSSAECTDSAASLKCIWYWDAGRYSGATNAVSFYKGNRDPSTLSGAGMISTAVSNHWGSSPSTARCPCEKMQRYGAIVRLNGGTPFWSDTGASTSSYVTVTIQDYRMICAIEQSTTTTTTTTTTSTTTTTPAPTTTTTGTTTTPAPTTTTTGTTTTTTTTAEPLEENNGVDVPLVVGLSVAVAVVLIVIIAVIMSIVCCGGCSCLGGASGAASASSTLSASRRESLSRGSSFNSRGSSLRSRSNSFSSRCSDTGSRGRYSFHKDESMRKSSSRRSSACMRKGSSRRSSSSRSFEDDVIPWKNDE